MVLRLAIEDLSARTPSARHASASTITPASAAAPSTESVAARPARVVDSKRYSAAHAHRDLVFTAPTPTLTSAASFLSRMWGAARGTSPVAHKLARILACEVDVHIVDASEPGSHAPRAYTLGPRFVGSTPGGGSFRRLVQSRSAVFHGCPVSFTHTTFSSTRPHLAYMALSPLNLPVPISLTRSGLSWPLALLLYIIPLVYSVTSPPGSS
jgi:hypothetical protein